MDTPYSAPWVFQDYVLDRPATPPPVKDLAAAIVRGDVAGGQLEAVAQEHRLADWNALKGDLLDLVLYYVEFALRDHALAPEELQTVRDLKRFLHIEEGDFWGVRRERVQEIVGFEMARILLDGRIDRAEELHQVEVQALFDLSYDQYLSLTKECVARAVADLEAALAESRAREPSTFLDWLLTRRPKEQPLAAAIREALAGLETIYRLQGPAGAARDTAEPGRGISQEVRDRVWRRDRGRCVMCGSQENLEYDHIIPFSKGGASTYRNVQLLCQDCNRRKSAQIG